MFFRFETELLRCCLVRTLLSHAGLSTEEGGTVLRPDLAADLPGVSPDGLTWTFRLKEGLHYAPPLEDVEITAGDIVRAIQRTAADVAEGAHGAFYSVIQGYEAYAAGDADTISGVEEIDDHTLRVHLIQVTNDFGNRMTLPASAPIPPSSTDPTAPFGVATGHDDGYGRYLVASGPYMVEGAGELDPSRPPSEQPSASGLAAETLTLVRNPSWHRSKDELRGAYVDRIEHVAPAASGVGARMAPASADRGRDVPRRARDPRRSLAGARDSPGASASRPGRRHRCADRRRT